MKKLPLTKIQRACRSAQAGNADALHEPIKKGKGNFDETYRLVSDAYDSLPTASGNDPALNKLALAMAHMRNMVIEAEALLSEIKSEAEIKH